MTESTMYKDEYHRTRVYNTHYRRADFERFVIGSLPLSELGHDTTLARIGGWTSGYGHPITNALWTEWKEKIDRDLVANALSPQHQFHVKVDAGNSKVQLSKLEELVRGTRYGVGGVVKPGSATPLIQTGEVVMPHGAFKSPTEAAERRPRKSKFMFQFEAFLGPKMSPVWDFVVEKWVDDDGQWRGGVRYADPETQRMYQLFIAADNTKD